MQKFNVYVRILLSNVTTLLFLLSLVFVILIVPMRLICNSYVEDILVAAGIVLMSAYFIYFARYKIAYYNVYTRCLLDF